MERLAGNSQFRHILNNRRSFCTIRYYNASPIGTFPQPSPMSLCLALISPMISLFPRGETWNVQSIDADGLHPGPGLSTVSTFSFTPTTRGLPGTQVYSAMNQPFSVSGSTFTVNLPSLAVLAAGTYWVEIQANMMFIPKGAWIWTDRTLVEPGRSLAKPGWRLWYLPDLGSENNMCSRNRRTRPGVPA